MKNLIRRNLTNIFIFSIVMTGGYADAGVLLDQNNLKYLGAFKVPQNQTGCGSEANCSFSFGGGTPAFYKDGNGGAGSLFLGGNDQTQKIAEISIPTLVNSSNIDDLNTASLLQDFKDPTDGNRINTAADGGACYNTPWDSSSGNCNVKIGGLMVWGNKLIGSVFTYYFNFVQPRSHFTSSLNLSTTNDFSGMYQLGDGTLGRTAGGYMCKIPTAWQSSFGGPALTGKGGLSIAANASQGPAAYVFNPDQLGAATPVPATTLVTYPAEHPLATDSASWSATAQVTGVIFPEGSDSVLFFGRNGNTPMCYGPGSNTLSENGNMGNYPSPNNVCNGTVMTDMVDKCCYDPYDSGKGSHAAYSEGETYKYQVWAYSAAELLSVKNGTKNPWEARPYAVWNFSLPFLKTSAVIGGVSYDPATQRVYISKVGAQTRGYASLPVVHVFEVTLNSVPGPAIKSIDLKP